MIQKYTIELLEEIITRDCAKLIDIKNKKNNLTSESKITFICGFNCCSRVCTKLFSSLVTSIGCYCEECVKNIVSNKTNKKRFDIELLNTCLNRDGAELVKIDDANNLLSRRSKITFICGYNGCKNIHTKVFNVIVNISGCYCKKCTNIIMLEKTKKTNMERRGVENVFQDPIIKSNNIQTHISKRGVSNPSQDPEVRRKQMSKRYDVKDYIFPSGKVEEVQGYEPQALDKLLHEGYLEEDIIVDTEKQPIIKYTIDGKEHRHFLDIYIKSCNKIIEVKSTYTFTLNTDIILEKQRASKEQGYEYEIWIMSKKGGLLEIYG